MMKQSTILLACSLCLSSVFAGTGATRAPRVYDAHKAPQQRQAQPGSSRSVNTFYSEDFSGGIPAGWQLVDNSGNGVNWDYTTTGASNTVIPTSLTRLSNTGTSAANGYMIYDSDASNQSVGGENADMITDVIDCSSYAIVHLTFNQLLYHFTETAKVFVSNDGTTWTEVYDASAPLAVNTATSNPNAVDLDISTLAANQATVYVKFNFTGDFDYWWMIDDVTLYEPVSFVDAGITAITNPVSNCAGLTSSEVIAFSVDNGGNADISGLDISFVLDGGAPVTETANILIAGGSTASLAFSVPANFSAPGQHTLTVYIAANGDSNALNDTLTTFVFNGTHPIDGTNSYSMGFEDNEDFTGWTIQDQNADGNTWGISNLLPRTGANCISYTSANVSQFANEWLFMPCTDFNDTTTYQLDYYYRTFNSATDAFMEVVLCSAPNSSALVAPIQSPITVNGISYLPGTNTFTVAASGTYYIAFHVLSASRIASLRLDDINLSKYVNTTGISTAEEKSLQVFPNPSQGQLFIKGGVDHDYQVTLTNALGASVYNQSFENLTSATLNLSGLTKGIYTLRMAGQQSMTVRQIVVE